MKKRPSPTLQRILLVRLSAVTLAVSVALTSFFFFRYMLDKPRLRELTLEADLKTIVVALDHHQDPAQWWQFQHYPEHYALRVFDHRTTDRRRLVTQVNTELLPALSLRQDGSSDLNISEGFAALQVPADRPGEDRWLLTDHVDVRKHSYWVQLAMVGDPDWRWRGAILDEMRDHVFIPLLFVIPALTLGLALSIRQSLRPLKRVAVEAETLNAALASGRPLAALSEARLPREIHSVVAAVNIMLGRLEELFLAQKQFTSDAAHELRTPIAVLLLQAAHLPPGPLREAITTELDGLARLVNQLLRFAQAEDMMTHERHLVDVGAVARSVCEDMASPAVGHRVSLAFDAPPNPVELLGHSALIDIAIRNLLDNAIRHSPPGGTVSVAVNADGTISVEDEGPGVSDEQKQIIFQRFYRADRQRSGTGIGLALVRRIARLHGGDAFAEDRPGGGARFVLRLTSELHPSGPPATGDDFCDMTCAGGGTGLYTSSTRRQNPNWAASAVALFVAGIAAI
jgi:signal transduction histidine kinase